MLFLFSFFVIPTIFLLFQEFVLFRFFSSPVKGIKHPFLYRFFDFCLLLSSAAAGPLLGLVRIIKALLFLVLFVERVDISLIPPPLQVKIYKW